MKNVFEFIYRNKIIKLSFEDIMFIFNPNEPLIDVIIDSLDGKNDKAYYNNQNIIKKQFEIVYVGEEYNLNNEMKYSSKSILWKRILKILSEDNFEISNKINIIKKQVDDIYYKLNNSLNIDNNVLINELSDQEIIKFFYKPFQQNDDNRYVNNLYKYLSLFDFYSKEDVFFIIKDEEIENNINLLLEVITNKPKNIKMIISISNINTVYHMMDTYPIYIPKLGYKEIDCSINELISNNIIEKGSINDIDILYLLNYLCCDNPKCYVDFLKKHKKYLIGKEIFDKFVNFYHLQQ